MILLFFIHCLAIFGSYRGMLLVFLNMVISLLCSELTNHESQRKLDAMTWLLPCFAFALRSGGLRGSHTQYICGKYKWYTLRTMILLTIWMSNVMQMTNVSKMRDLCSVLGINLLQRIRDEVDDSIRDIDSWLANDVRVETSDHLNSSVERLFKIKLERYTEVCFFYLCSIVMLIKVCKFEIYIFMHVGMFSFVSVVL